MKVTITSVTAQSKSPVYEVKSKSNFSLKMAITSDGNIYRLVKFSHKIDTIEPIEVELSEQTVSLVNNWLKYHQRSWNCDIFKLEIVQDYEISIHNSNYWYHPLYKCDINLRYTAKAALENYKEKSNLQKMVAQLTNDKTSLLQQITVLQAKLKVPAKMAERNCTEKQALAYILGSAKLDFHLTDLFAKKIVHPNSYIGRDKHVSKGTDYAAQIIYILKLSGIKHTFGNDAPKGGFSGEFIKIK